MAIFAGRLWGDPIGKLARHKGGRKNDPDVAVKRQASSVSGSVPCFSYANALHFWTLFSFDEMDDGMDIQKLSNCRHSLGRQARGPQSQVFSEASTESRASLGRETHLGFKSLHRDAAM